MKVAVTCDPLSMAVSEGVIGAGFVGRGGARISGFTPVRRTQRVTRNVARAMSESPPLARALQGSQSLVSA